MRIPKSVMIGGQRVSISVEENLAEYGQFCLDNLKITLRKADLQTMELTLRHEMIHAAFAISGLSYSKSFDDIEESVVRCLENTFFPAWTKLTSKNKRR